jgi:choline dehydrogenase
MQISGTNPQAHLRAIGVEVSHDLAGVGESVLDRYAARVANRVMQPITLNERARTSRLWLEIARWLVGGGGLLAFSPAYVGAFLRSRPGLAEPGPRVHTRELQ